MFWLRKFDWWLQLTIVIIALCGVPFTGMLTILYGQTVLGGLQLISGALHILIQLPAIFRNGIKKYWTVVIIYFAILLLLYFPGREVLSKSRILLIIVYVIIPWLIAFYYLFWYRKLINHLSYHKELAGLIKS